MTTTPIHAPCLSISTLFIALSSVCSAFTPAPDEAEPNAGWTVIAWNDLGMHCMDEDFAVFAILPPFNTINAQLIDPNGNLVPNSGNVTIYYEPAADPDASQVLDPSKYTNFWEYAEQLFGAQLAENTGLYGSEMPNVDNDPKAMHWNSANQWWTAEGIPIVPTDIFGDTQHYPLIRVTARNNEGTLLAETLTTAPVSAEMNCVTCHGSGSNPATLPTGGWVNDPDPVRDYRLNILKLHDSRRASNEGYSAALAEFGYDSNGLYETVTANAKPILCASCHASNALGTSGYNEIPPLTQAIHTAHTAAIDPITLEPMGLSTNRSSCYLCHPGKKTQCLRGAMGHAMDANGEPSVSCQSCHGGLADVGSSERAGWFNEPNCQSCHTGTYTNNSGQVRYTDARVADGTLREPADARFATNPDTPATGISLYRFSTGHGDLQCAACHGSPHATYPTNLRNDNLQSLNLQEHIGTVSDCTACHKNDTSSTRTTSGGPHGMHGIGQWWIKEHHDAIPEINDRRDTSACKACHGLDATGGDLSKALGPRTFSTEKGGPTITYFEGQRVSCYDCHRGPNESDDYNQAKPVVESFTLQTASDTAVAAYLQGSDNDTAILSYRIVSIPQHGTLSISGSQVVYTPDPAFVGTDVFTYCAKDNRTDSNLGIVNINVGSGANTVDADGDGIADLVERAFGLSTSRVNRGGAPEYHLYTDSSGERYIQAIYDPKLIPAGLTLVFEASPDLSPSSWDSEAGLIRSSNDQGKTVVRLPLPATGSAQYFLRCRVEQEF